jgi:membrane protein required for colicin V production
MNAIDIIILIILAFFCVKGFFRGLIMEAFTLVGLFLAYIIALREMSALAVVFGRAVDVPPWAGTALSFFVIFVVVVLSCRLIAGALRKFLQWTLLDWLDRGGGVVSGLFKGALVASLLALLVSLIPVSEEMERAQKQSFLFQPVRSVAPAVFNFVKRTIPQTKSFYEEVRETIDKTSDAVQSRGLSKQLEEFQEELEKRVKKDE